VADFDENDGEDLRETFHTLFGKYNVDLVLSGHTQYYQRTLPLSYNKDNDLHPVITNHKNYEDNNKNGIIFVTAGTVGDDLRKIDSSLPYAVIQERTHGFLNFDVKDNGNTLVGTFYGNKDLKVLDTFTLSKGGKYNNDSYESFASIDKKYHLFMKIKKKIPKHNIHNFIV